MKNNKGFAPVLIVLIIIGVLALGGEAYYFWTKKAQKPVSCTQEAKICPDGSAVGRTGPNCEFVQCPTAKPDETADWKTYRNEQYGFELEYPANWLVKNLDSNLINNSYKGTDIPVYKSDVLCDAMSSVEAYDNRIEIYDPNETNNKIVIFLANFTGHSLAVRQLEGQLFLAVNIDNLAKFQNGVEQYRSSDEIFESTYFDLSQMKSSIKLINKNYLFVYENKYLGGDAVPTECTDQHSKTDFVAYESIYEPLGKKLYRFIQVNIVKNQSDVFNEIKSSINFF